MDYLADNPGSKHLPFAAPPLPDAVHTSLVHLPWRDYLLFDGPLEAATEFGWSLTEECFIPHSPNLFWPQDHAWCVATEIDLLSTLFAGSESLAQNLLADPRLEAWRVFPEDHIT